MMKAAPGCLPRHPCLPRHQPTHRALGSPVSKRFLQAPPTSCSRQDSTAFPVYTVVEKLLGHATCASDSHGAAATNTAINLGAHEYGLSHQDIRAFVRLDGHGMLEASATASMPVSQLESHNAAFYVEQPAQPLAVSLPFLLADLGKTAAQREEAAAQREQAAVQLKKQVEELSKTLEEQGNKINHQGNKINNLEEQLAAVNENAYYPLCHRELLIQADLKLTALARRRGSGTRGQRHEAPEWARALVAQQTIRLNPKALDTIFATTAGSLRGDANIAVHSMSIKEQARAVCAMKGTNPEMYTILAQVFAFTHGRNASDYGYV